MDIARGEAVEAELDAMIRRRDEHRRQTEGERLEADLWAESVERFNARARQENRVRWYGFHANMAELHSRLANEHAQKAEALCVEERGRGVGSY